MPDQHPSADCYADLCGRVQHRVRLVKVSSNYVPGAQDLRQATIRSRGFAMLRTFVPRCAMADVEVLRTSLSFTLAEESSRIGKIIANVLYKKACDCRPQDFVNWRKLLRRSRSET